MKKNSQFCLIYWLVSFNKTSNADDLFGKFKEYFFCVTCNADLKNKCKQNEYLYAGLIYPAGAVMPKTPYKKAPQLRGLVILLSKFYSPFRIDAVLSQHFLNANELVVLSHTVGTTGRTGFNLSAIQCHC